MAKNEQYIQNSVRIQSTAVPAGSSSNGGRGIDCRAPVSSRSVPRVRRRPDRVWSARQLQPRPEIRHLLRRTSGSAQLQRSNSRAAGRMGDCRTRATDIGADSSGLWGLQVFISGGVGQPSIPRRPAGRRHLRRRCEAIYGYEDFERIKDNGRIDVVYIVLPNSMHAEYTIRALQSGKHVLCEKPMAASLAECEAMIDASAKREDPRRRLSSAL